MAKIKNARIAGYMISCNANGAISVAKDYDNQRQALRDIAKSIGYEDYNPDWGTQQLGKKVIEQITGEHVANKDEASAVSNEYIVFKDAAGPIHVFKDYDNVKGALREISEKIGFEYDTEWNTRQFGSKLIAHINGDAAANLQKDETPGASSVCEEDTEEEKHTYYLRVEAETLWRFDTLQLENAEDDVIREAFENETPWTSIVGETKNLYCLKEDMDSESVFGYDEDDVNELASIIGDNGIYDTQYMPDANDDLSIVVMDKNQEEIETIDGSDLVTIQAEQCYPFRLEDVDEDDEEIYNVAKKYIEENKNIDSEFADHAFPTCDPEKWFWLNAQSCPSDEHAIYRLEISGEFDVSKLALKKTLVEEALSGMMSIEVISEILYDGVPVEIEECAYVGDESSTNFFIKMDSKGHFPEKIYDFTNNEES